MTVLTGLVMRSTHRLMVCEKWRRAFLRLFHPARRNAAMRVLRICRLYLQPPAGAVVLSIDEKTAIAARSRKHPGRGVRPGHYARQEFE